MQQALAAHDGKHFGALLLIDMDRLQHINHARGYEFGSQLIKLWLGAIKAGTQRPYIPGAFGR